MKQFLHLALSVLPFFCSFPAAAVEVFNLNVFDQLQGKWDAGFREKRLAKVAQFLGEHRPEIVVFEEAQGLLPGKQGGGPDSADSQALQTLYPFRKYVHEMTGADGASYGYWIGARKKPRAWIEDGFSFPGGVSRKVLGGVWGSVGSQECLGVLGLHWSYQNSEVRQQEAHWLLDWLKAHEKECAHWLVVGDFNADAKTKEMRVLFEGGLQHLFQELKPTVGAFNPIRRIYGDTIPSLTIDWALGWNLQGEAAVVLDSPYEGEWVSDHAGITIHTK